MTSISAAEFQRQLLAGDALPAGLTVRGDLSLIDCPALTTLPAGLTVGGSLYLDDCPALTALPPGLTVGGSLVLVDCPGLDHLRVGTDARGYRFYAVPMRDGVRVIAGCRNYTPAEARAHWPEGTECRELAEKCIKKGDGT